MSLSPLSEFDPIARSTSAHTWAADHPGDDLILLEPFERDRDYGGAPHPAASWMVLPRELNRPVPIGRDARAMVQIDHAAVSRLHAVLAWTGETWKIMDRSSNGVWLEGERLPQNQAVPIGYGAKLRLGRAFVLRLLTPEAFHDLARPTGAPAAPAEPIWGGPPPPSDARSETWRFPAVQADAPFGVSGAPLRGDTPLQASPFAPAAPILPPHDFDAAPAPLPASSSFAPAAALVRPEEFTLEMDFAHAPEMRDEVIGGEAPVAPVFSDEAPSPPPLAPMPPSPPRVPRPPAIPMVPQPPRLPPGFAGMNPSASPEPEFTGDIEFDFGSKFENDGKGGFA